MTIKDRDMKKFEEVTVSTKPIFQGNIISLQVDVIKLPDGKEATREIIRHPGAVAVLALTGDKEKMLVVEQYRKPLERSQVEIPAGKLDPGEEIAAAARRELEEETGYRCNSLQLVHSFYTSPGFADEIIHLFVAEQLEHGQSNPDEDEFLEFGEITLEEAEQWISEGRIRDAKTIMAVYIWKLYKQTGKLM